MSDYEIFLLIAYRIPMIIGWLEIILLRLIKDESGKHIMTRLHMIVGFLLSICPLINFCAYLIPGIILINSWDEISEWFKETKLYHWLNT